MPPKNTAAPKFMKTYEKHKKNIRKYTRMRKTYEKT